MAERAAGPPAPRQRGLGLAAQYGLLLLGALVATHLLAMMLLQRTGTLVHPISREQALATLVSASALAGAEGGAAAPAALRDGLGALRKGLPGPGDGVALWIAAAPQVGPFAMQPEEAGLAAELRARIALPPPQGLWAQIERTSGEQARAPLLSLAAWEPLRLRASIELPGGRWLNASLGLQGRYDWSHILLYTVPASVLPVLAVAMLLAWRLVRPLRALIAATARVRQGRELPALPLRGPREARELTRQFNAMQQRIARHRDARVRMLAAISHDLRSPVTALRLQAELVEDAALRGELSASVAELQAMVEQTLDFARADAHAEPARTVDVAAMLQALARRYRRLGRELPLRPPALPPLVWTCCPLALQRALANLIDNAFEHAGGAAVEAAWSAEALELRVSDDGPGIAEDLIAQVFEPFAQLDAARGPGRSGLGLGLSIAQACVEMQGGSLTLANRPEGGLCACIRLPRVPPAGGAATPAPAGA